MKFALFLLVALPMVLCVPVEERALIDQFTHLFSNAQLHTLVCDIKRIAGSDATEASCESACHQVIHNAILTHGCPLVCKSLQALINHYKC